MGKEEEGGVRTPSSLPGLRSERLLSRMRDLIESETVAPRLADPPIR